MRAPILVVVGDRDPITPPAMAQRVAGAAAEAACREIRVIRGGAHGNLVYYPTFWAALGEFVARVVPGAVSKTPTSPAAWR